MFNEQKSGLDRDGVAASRSVGARRLRAARRNSGGGSGGSRGSDVQVDWSVPRDEYLAIFRTNNEPEHAVGGGAPLDEGLVPSEVQRRRIATKAQYRELDVLAVPLPRCDETLREAALVRAVNSRGDEVRKALVVYVFVKPVAEELVRTILSKTRRWRCKQDARKQKYTSKRNKCAEQNDANNTLRHLPCGARRAQALHQQKQDRAARCAADQFPSYIPRRPARASCLPLEL